MHASNKPRSMGKSLLSTCMICSMSVQNGSQHTAKETTTVPVILINNTNLQSREKAYVKKDVTKMLVTNVSS